MKDQEQRGLKAWRPNDLLSPHERAQFGLTRTGATRLSPGYIPPRLPWHKRLTERLRDIWHTVRWGRE